MTTRHSFEAGGPAPAYPLLLKQLLRVGLARRPEQEIVHRDRGRYAYQILGERIARLAGVLAQLGIVPGDTVAVMDWDSHRYLECMFAVPMIGAILQTVNVRLSPEQILYTMNHAGAKLLLINGEFLPVLDAIRPRLETVTQLVLLTDEPAPAPTGALNGALAFLPAEVYLLPRPALCRGLDALHRAATDVRSAAIRRMPRSPLARALRFPRSNLASMRRQPYSSSTSWIRTQSDRIRIVTTHDRAIMRIVASCRRVDRRN